MVEKKITTISIDSKVLSRAKMEIPNLSDFIENCLKVYLDVTGKEDTVKSIQDELDKIKEARLKIHLLSESQNNEEDLKLFDEDKLNKAWLSIWRSYRSKNVYHQDDLVEASVVLNVPEDDLVSMMQDLIYNVDGSDLVKCDDWNIAYDLHQKMLSE